jgi:hypothetical protein
MAHCHNHTNRSTEGRKWSKPSHQRSALARACQQTVSQLFAGKKGLCDYVATNQVGTSTWKGVPLDSQASQQWGQWLVLFDVLLWLYHTWMGVQNKIDVETTTTTTTIIIDIARNGITYHITMKYHTYSHIKTILIYIYIIYISILISIESDDIWNYHSGG